MCQCDSVCENIDPYRVNVFMLNLEWLAGNIGVANRNEWDKGITKAVGKIGWAGRCRPNSAQDRRCATWNHKPFYSFCCDDHLKFSGCFKDDASFKSFSDTVEKAKKLLADRAKKEKKP